MANIVVIDGPRGVGKSTMSRQLVDLLVSRGYTATYFKKEIRDPDDEHGNMLRHIDQFVKLPEQVVVVDRFVITEWVLSSYFNRKPHQQLYRYCYDVYDTLRALRAVHVVLYADEQTLTSRLDSRGTRQWDMHPSSLALWRTAELLFPDLSLWTNQDKSDWDQNLTLLYVQVLSRIDREAYRQLSITGVSHGT